MANILIIEDNIAIGRVVQMALEDTGHNVEWCKSGTEALDVLERELPDLVMTDLGIPGKSGKEIVEKMRSEYRLLKVPAIIMTANLPDSYTFPEEKSYQGLLVKPFNLDDLKDTVQRLVS
ncbi:response regulator [Desulfosporosinus sp. SB140]|uniref:response regulator n=1 Tax=Desulfosporosinus paludis TaxID=3115649 RepID=UPI00388F382B